MKKLSVKEVEGRQFCVECHYELTPDQAEKYGGKCYQCFINEGEPDQETLEGRY